MKYLAFKEKDGNREILDHPTLHDAISAIKKELSKDNLDLEEMETDKYKVENPPVKSPVDLRKYTVLEKVMNDLGRDLKHYPLIRRCFLEFQPELKNEILQYDPTVSDEKKIEVSRKYFTADRKEHFEQQLDPIKKDLKNLDEYERYKGLQRLKDLLNGKVTTRERREDQHCNRGYISEETVKENQANFSVSIETLASNSFAHHHVVSSKRRKKKNAKSKVRQEMEEAELVISCTKFQTITEDSEESAMQNFQKSNEERIKKLMKKHRYEAGVSYETNQTSGKPNKRETIDYQRSLVQKNKIVLIPPKQIPNARIRRKISEGSYPNWTVIEDNLPHLLRYTWKAKLKKLEKFLSRKSKHKEINNEDCHGRTALHYAASWACIRTLGVLIRVPKININARDEHGKTPLYKAVEINSIEFVEALIALGANVLISAFDGRDAITYTLTTYGDERFEMFKFLYQKKGYSNECYESGKVTLLHKAIGLCEQKVMVLKCIQYMLKYGSQNIDAKEANGRTPVHLAAMLGRDDLLRILLAYEPNIFHMDNERKTAHDYASTNKSEILCLLDRYMRHGSDTDYEIDL